MRNAGIAEVNIESHIHPEFDFSSKIPVIKYAQVKIRPYNTALLKEFVNYFNSRLRSQANNLKLKLWAEPNRDEEYNLQIYHEPTSDRNRWNCLF